jgi:S-adenosylmethionine decarboxylase
VDGLHLIADLHLCRPKLSGLMTEPDALESFCLATIKEAGLRSVAHLFHSFKHLAASPVVDVPEAEPNTSSPSGITGVVLLAESHCAIHTWPETGSVTIDVYVCNYGQDNSAKARQLMNALVETFAPERFELKEILRGS